MRHSPFVETILADYFSIQVHHDLMLPQRRAEISLGRNMHDYTMHCDGRIEGDCYPEQVYARQQALTSHPSILIRSLSDSYPSISMILTCGKFWALSRTTESGYHTPRS